MLEGYPMLYDSDDVERRLPDGALEDAVIKAMELREVVLGLALNDLTLLADLMLLELGRRSRSALLDGCVPERLAAA
ncbi:MAG: hypothetical protein INR70_39510 [Parafilimonas terrae]|nr:hypothetical protein [Parafilimonas terrae]